MRPSNANIISHMSHHHHSTLLPNPEKQRTNLSYSKTVPLNVEVMKERS